MVYDPDIHHRRSIRLKHYDYAKAGAYFVTICVHRREMLLGKIENGAMCPSEIGSMVVQNWDFLPQIHPNLEPDAFVVMPNHVHAVLLLDGKGKSLSAILRGFKTYTAREANILRDAFGNPFWQRNYFERIVRDERELLNARRYIAENPQRWPHDRHNPDIYSQDDNQP